MISCPACGGGPSLEVFRDFSPLLICPCGALRLRPEDGYWSRGGSGYSRYSGYLRYSSHGASVSALPDGSLVFRPEAPADVDSFVRQLVDEAVAGWILGC